MGRRGANQSFSINLSTKEQALHNTAKDLFIKKIKLYFPNAAPPNYYTDGFEHCLSFMEYEITTTKTFRSQSYAENWLFTRATKMVEETYRVATAQLELEKERRMAEYKQVQERQDKNRSLSDSIRSKARSIELEYKQETRRRQGGGGGSAASEIAQEPQRKDGLSEGGTGVRLGALSNAPNSLTTSRNMGKMPGCTDGVYIGDLRPIDHPSRTNELYTIRSPPKTHKEAVDDMLRGNSSFHTDIFPLSESSVDEQDASTSGARPASGRKHRLYQEGADPDSVKKTKNINNAYSGGGLLDASRGNGNTSPLGPTHQADCRGNIRNALNKQNGISQGPAGSESDFVVPQKEYFDSLVKKFEDEKHAFIAVIRSFCSFHTLFPPEFETVRENDVYRCTATFCNMNFVSPYLYDKIDAKNGACKKIYHYISQNWNAVFASDREQRLQAAHMM